MASLVSQFGAASLAVQERLRRSVDRSGSVPQAPNVVVVSLDRETFAREQGGSDRAEVERFREALRHDIDAFLMSNEWGMAGPLSLNILLRSMNGPCEVTAEKREALYSLKIRDDSGERVVSVSWPIATLGREHDAPPRHFIAVRDGSRSLSREHLLLSFRDLELHALLRGLNPTTLNREPMAREVEIVLHSGDLIRCGPHAIEVTLEVGAEIVDRVKGLPG